MIVRVHILSIAVGHTLLAKAVISKSMYLVGPVIEGGTSVGDVKERRCGCTDVTAMHRQLPRSRMASLEPRDLMSR